MASSPIVARWELSRRLAALRKDRGLDVKAITDHLGFTRNYWSAVENDRTLIAADKLQLFFELLDLDSSEREELLTLRKEVRERGWWDEHPILSDNAKRLCGLEEGAIRILDYENQYIPGLLQTEAYARAIVASEPGFSKANHDQLVEVRLRRQLVLTRERPVEFVALVSEAVLLQEHAGRVAQIKQLEHIGELLDRHPHIEVRILPFTTNPGVISSASTLLFFEFGREPHLPTLAWQESLRLFGPVEKSDPDFPRLEIAWNEGLANSLNRVESRRLIASHADQLRAG